MTGDTLAGTEVDTALGSTKSEDWLYRDRGAEGSGGWTNNCDGSIN